MIGTVFGRGQSDTGSNPYSAAGGIALTRTQVNTLTAGSASNLLAHAPTEMNLRTNETSRLAALAASGTGTVFDLFVRPDHGSREPATSEGVTSVSR